MTKKQFWQGASNWGFLGGAALFAVNIVGWALRLETSATWLYELLVFVIVCPLIIYTGRRNAAAAGSEGYSYSRAVGYVFALMMFAGIVYGVGRFLMVNFIAREYYDAINASAMESAMTVYRGTAMEAQMAEMRGTLVRMLANPFVLIVSAILNLVIKGGFLGLLLGSFLKKNPDFFASGRVDEGGGEGAV
ncbi:MAG: DUF4199 domain-containing protein [Alistipes sp.]|jgi:hypothetical protein|nr:DUF4199 domain-containing protein [Alistipes sp.]